MRTSRTVAFWSYAHRDNALTDGAIVALARSVSREDALLTGYPIERADDLFVDCQGIGWGDDWRACIDRALEETNVLIPVLSPWYFKRPECRRELESFLARDEALVLPILFLPIEDFTADNDDELLAWASQLQYEDWTSLRLADPGEARKRAVNRLARRLREAVPSPEAFAELAAIEALWPGLREANTNLRIVAAQYKATREVLREDGWVPRSSGEGLLAPRFHEATQLTPLEERCLAWAGVQLARTEELDPLITSVLEQAEARADVRALRTLDADVRRLTLSEPIGITPQDEAQANVRLKHVMRDLADVAPQTERDLRAANERMLRWGRRLEAIMASGEQRGSA
jgi:TIR domain